MKITITIKQAQQFNQMLHALRQISKYQSPEKLRKGSEKDWALHYEEALEMSYDNIQSEAKLGCKGIRPLKFQ